MRVVDRWLDSMGLPATTSRDGDGGGGGTTPSLQHQEFATAFAALDLDNDGHLSAEELRGLDRVRACVLSLS